MKKITQLLFILFPTLILSQVGIGTTNPDTELHIAGTNSTIRIESLNSSNNINNDGIKLAPVFVDGNGDLTLTPPNGTGGEPLNFLLDIPNFIPDNPHSLPFDSGVVINNNSTGETSVEGFIHSVTFTVPQTAVVEVKYGVTIVITDVDMTIPALSYITDNEARTIETFFCFDINNDGLDVIEKSKQFGQKAQFYASNWGGSLGYPYMNSQGYATLPPGTHSIHFFGIVNDSATSYTSVGFGGATDYLKMRVYN
ncbi:hypothetical protein [Pseudofulvibacter geojedonensis]|uniref:Uncharacterized protein n=1 Tax=Pseudofulvibacter geojedonensis TaxID=1123758 RepID=A0ABW3I435_9FLAO